MFSKLRGLMVAVMICALLATPAAASTFTSGSDEVDEGSVNVVVDTLILRPIGLVVTAAGAVLYGLTVPIVAITRPKDIKKPLEPLVLAPARYTFVDPIGQH